MSVFISEGVPASNPYLNCVRVVHGDIVQQDTDAIVTLIPQSLEYPGAINKAIQDCAGAEIEPFIRDNVARPKAGDIYAAPGFDLPCRHIFFCVVPVWKDDWDRHDKQLLNATRKAMELATRMGLKSLSYPPMGTGKRAFPKSRAVRLITQGIADRIDESFEDIRIVCRTPSTQKLFEEKLRGV